jgi:hypothetical protein
VRINARPVGWQLSNELGAGQTGLVERSQRQTKTSSTGNQLLPATVTGGAGGGIVSVSASVGDQVKHQSGDAFGTRLETSAFRDGDLVTVRVPMVYDATIEEQTDKGRGTPETKRTTQLNDVGRAEFYATMLYHEYREGLRQMEAGEAISLDGYRLQAVPEKLGKPDLRATEYGQDASGQRVHQPYQPLLAAIDKAMAERKIVVLAVDEADGTERLYQAVPRRDPRTGGLHVELAGVNDGGFASAVGKLDRRLVQWAEQRVDLRELFNTMPPDGNFNSTVADALEQNGVPTAMLKGLDYSRSVRPATPESGQGVKPTIGGAAAGRAVAPSGSGPFLAGP